MAAPLTAGCRADPKKFFAQGSLEQNMAILGSMALLYSSTGEPKLLIFCKMVLAELQIPPAGDYISAFLYINDDSSI